MIGSRTSLVFQTSWRGIYATFLCHTIASGTKTPAVTDLSFGLENQRVFTGTVGSNPTLSALKAQSVTGFFNA
ncbi:hypothetical protein SynA1825c_02178 [Synechococcus sp. A18-25c]|nr:hypothetical protein SynA1825c_02178 [Synechococcus sp. A18-25c]